MVRVGFSIRVESEVVIEIVDNNMTRIGVKAGTRINLRVEIFGKCKVRVRVAIEFLVGTQLIS